MKLLGRRAECEFLDGALADALDGRSRVVVLRGDAGAGKSALLNFVAERATGWRVATAVGIESEMELAYGGLHQLCAPMLDHLDQLPTPQRDALGTVFGLLAGEPPDRFLVGLATLTLLAEVADDGSLSSVSSTTRSGSTRPRRRSSCSSPVDSSPSGSSSCARRGRASVTASSPGSLPCRSHGLSDSDARTLLLENLPGPIDAAVCEQIITESHGNPLALLELPRTWNTAELAGGFGIPARQPVGSKIEQSFAKRLQLLPAETQLLVLAAAAEPLGDPLLLHRAAENLGLDPAASGPALDAGLLDVSGRVEFAHPLVRSAAYSSATADDRQRVHRALAEATDPERDPDRRAWHRARAAPAPDENVAAELERSAGRAQARGGVAAAAAFLERASALSPDSAKRAQRALRAAEAKQLAGAPEAASTLLAVAIDGPLDELESASAQRLKGQIALDLRRGGEATPLLLEAASRLEASRSESRAQDIPGGAVCGELRQRRNAPPRRRGRAERAEAGNRTQCRRPHARRARDSIHRRLRRRREPASSRHSAPIATRTSPPSKTFAGQGSPVGSRPTCWTTTPGTTSSHAAWS